MQVLASLLAASALLAAGTAFGHGSANEGKARPAPAHAGTGEKAFGRPGDPGAVSRTIRIVGTDDMRYAPSSIRVRRDETVRFVVHNAGKMPHETVLGTKAELDEHYALMKKFPEMEHDEPHMVHLGPGESGEIVWQFSKSGSFHFACLIPGHWEAGMGGTIEVE